MKVQISQNASSPPPQGMSSLGMRGEGELRVKYEQFYEFFPDKSPCSVAMRKVKKRRRLLACCPSQATAITGHSPASSCSWGKGCPYPPRHEDTPALPVPSPLLLYVPPHTSNEEYRWPGLVCQKTWQMSRQSVKNTNFLNSMGALSNPISLAIRIPEQFLFSF